MIKEKLMQDLKEALLSKDSDRATLIRGLKSAILYVEVAEGKREEGLSDEACIAIFQKEAKKRQESADMYVQGGDQTRANKELAEKKLIEAYLPAQLGEAEITSIVEKVIAETGAADVKAMGQVIGAVKAQTKGSADGALIAKIVKEQLNA
jgi:uncharacterized protein